MFHGKIKTEKSWVGDIRSFKPQMSPWLKIKPFLENQCPYPIRIYDHNAKKDNTPQKMFLKKLINNLWYS